MKWSDKAIILSARKFGESSAVINLITPEFGMYSGIDKGALSKSKRGIYQIGNIVAANWRARLFEQLGMINCELEQPVAAIIMDEPLKLTILNSAASMTEKILLEREAQPIIFSLFETLIQSLCNNGDYLADYVRLELSLLACSGFGIDLMRCAATGLSDDLIYVSPKSGRAVSRDAGEDYKEKLLSLPAFLNTQHSTCAQIDIEDIFAGLKLCGYFLSERIFTQRNIIMPAARGRFITMLSNSRSVKYANT